MDSQHPHDHLEDNDLHEFLTNFREWWSKWGNAVLTIIAVICLAVAVYLILHARAVQSHETAWNDLNNSSSPETLGQVASQHDVPAVRAQANLWSGDLYRTAAQSSSDEAAGGAAASQPSSAGPKLTREQKLARAQAAYQAVLRESKQPLFKLNALRGLAKVAEDQGQWKQASEYYHQIQSLGKQSGYTNFTAEAAAALSHLPRLQQPVTFAPATQPATQPTTQPAATQATPSPAPATH